MGMFDHVRSSYKLGKEFEGVNQTKDINDGGLMHDYWIDPSGRIWHVDTSGTQDFVPNDRSSMRFTFKPNGTHGKVRPLLITNYVEIYPERYNGPGKYPRCRIHFVDGVIKSFSLDPKHYYEIPWS